MEFNDGSSIIIGAAIRVHTRLGPGLLESAYEACLAWELLQAGLQVERQKPVPLIYEGVEMKCGYRIDLLIDSHIVVEIKAAEKMDPIYIAQTLTYMKLSGCRTALLINFNVALLKDGIRRLVL